MKNDLSMFSSRNESKFEQDHILQKFAPFPQTLSLYQIFFRRDEHFYYHLADQISKVKKPFP